MAEKAAIEVDDDSLSEASKENIDLSGLSSDDSSFEDNEQMLQTASRQGPSKVTRFATQTFLLEPKQSWLELNSLAVILYLMP